LAKAKTGRSNQVRSNIKQLGLAIRMYADDYRDRFPTVARRFLAWTSLPKLPTRS